MCNTDDRVPWKLIMSQYEGGVLTSPSAAGGHPPAMFPEASSLPTDETPLVSWQVIVVWVDVTPAGDSSEQESPCDSQNRRRPMDMNNSLDNLVYNAIQKGPVGPQEEEPLALLFLVHVNPKRFLGPHGPKVEEPLIYANLADQRTDIHRATGFWELELDPTINRNLDSRPMVGTTYLERPAPAVYLDSRPTEGKVRSKRVEWKPMRISAINRNLDSQPMVGTTYLERQLRRFTVTVGLWKRRFEARTWSGNR